MVFRFWYFFFKNGFVFPEKFQMLLILTKIMAFVMHVVVGFPNY